MSSEMFSVFAAFFSAALFVLSVLALIIQFIAVRRTDADRKNIFRKW